jgi:hypothetical protein
MRDSAWVSGESSIACVAGWLPVYLLFEKYLKETAILSGQPETEFPNFLQTRTA